MVSIHAEPTFERLRYILGGDRPSQTARLTVSHYPIQGSWLEIQQTKGGIPRMTPHRLTSMLHSLPPILYMNYRFPVLSCSKAPWGLSVLSRVTGIFTGTTISPGGLLRQCPDLQLRSQIVSKWKTMWKYADNQDVGSEAATHLKSA